MKHYLFILAVCASIISCDVRRKDKVSDDLAVKAEAIKKDSLQKIQVALQDSTQVELIDTVHQFGTIKEGEIAEFSFRFKNVGGKPLIISDAHASCGCTVPQKPERPIMPGEIGFIKVAFNSRGKQGHQDKAIMVSSNANPSFPDMRMVGEVKAAD